MQDRTPLEWLQLAVMLDGRFCVFCGYTWVSRETVLARAPIVASKGAKDLACQLCWNKGKRLPV